MFISDELQRLKDEAKVELARLSEISPRLGFVEDDIDAWNKYLEYLNRIVIEPFNAGDTVAFPDDEIKGTAKTNKETYSNHKAQAHGVSAQKLYNTFRFVELDEDVDSRDMISIDIEDDATFNKLVKELSCPIWVKSGTNSKKRVEDKKDMKKRTGQESPNIADSFH